MTQPEPSSSDNLISAIRARFANIDHCPFQGPRIYFENGGGALTLKSVIDTSAKFAGIPDNQGRDNPAAAELTKTIEKAKTDLAILMNAESGQFVVGETGTELLFRMVRAACLNVPQGSKIIGSSIEHPASRSAATHWAQQAELDYVNVQHDNETGMVTAEDYAAHLTPDVSVATILHASPVTGMGMDVAAISNAIRSVSPHCFIIVDGIQHAAHGSLDLTAYNVDGYAISPYKVFSRHGYGVAWISERLTALPHEALVGGPENNWELGTRDTAAYAAMSDVVSYFDWLGGEVSNETDTRRRIDAAALAIHRFEIDLTDTLINGCDGLLGLRQLKNVNILAGADNPAREGTVSFSVEGVDSTDIVQVLNMKGIRAHTRKADHYSGNILEPLHLADCVRISMCHYNTRDEVKKALSVLQEVIG